MTADFDTSDFFYITGIFYGFGRAVDPLSSFSSLVTRFGKISLLSSICAGGVNFRDRVVHAGPEIDRFGLARAISLTACEAIQATAGIFTGMGTYQLWSGVLVSNVSVLSFGSLAILSGAVLSYLAQITQNYLSLR